MNRWFLTTAAVATCCVFSLAQGDENIGTSESGLTGKGRENIGTSETGLSRALKPPPPQEPLKAEGGAQRQDMCKQGFVWRDAVAEDRVCVTPATRDQAKRDNAAAGGRWTPGPYGPETCKDGYVWREVTPKDRVCVTPEVRDRVLDDNSQSAARKVK
jgi:hypothetical protein